MIKKIWDYAFGSKFRKGASILTILTFGSYLLGLVRDMIFSRAFGASHMLDAYYAAFNVPDLMLNVFVASALTAAFVPVFTHLWAKGEEKEAEKVATTMLAVMPIIIIVVCIAAFFLMPWLAPLVAPGFPADQKDLLISMSRLLLLSPLIFAFSNTIGGILISYEHFIGYGLSPILYNVGLIAGIPFVKYIGPQALILGAIFGALLHLLSRVIELKRTRFKMSFPIDTKNQNFRQILKLMIPRMAGQPIEQVMYLMFTSLASTFAAGSVTMMNFARNFQSVPVSIFGISLTLAAFPALAKKAAHRDHAGFMRSFWETAKALTLTTVASGIFYFFAGELVVRIFLGGGKFTPDQVVQTGHLIAIFAFSVPFQSYIFLLARSFYALKDTWTSLFVALPGLIAIVVFAKLLTPVFGLGAIPASYSIVLVLEVAIMYILLMKKIRTQLSSPSAPSKSPHP